MYRSETAVSPPEAVVSTPARSTPGWIETGLGVMVLPLTLSMLAMIAPVLWIAGASRRR